MNIAARAAHSDILKQLGAHAAALGLKAWVVGGCVRDWYLGRATTDIDVVTEGDCAPLADFAARLLGCGHQRFSAFGTCRLTRLAHGSPHLDFARARKEVYSAPAALPRVSFADIRQDLYRRDFTVNTLAMSIMPQDYGEVFDPFAALADIDAGLLRVLHDASFADDPTRLLRLARFAGRFGWRADEHTAALARVAARENYCGLLSAKRRGRELLCILKEDNPAAAFNALECLGLADAIYPGLRWQRGADDITGLLPRLAVLAAALDERGADFLRGVELPRAQSADIADALEAAKRAVTPARKISAHAADIVKALVPGLAPQALQTRFINGHVLAAAGIADKRGYAAIINRFAALQWQGRFADAAAARAALKEYLAQ